MIIPSKILIIIAIMFIGLVGVLAKVKVLLDVEHANAERMTNNFDIAKGQIIHWTNDSKQEVYAREALELKANELSNAADSSIQLLTKIIRQQGVKIKNLDYELSIESGLQIDTITNVRVDTVNRIIQQYVDSIEIGDLHIKHLLFLKGAGYKGRFIASYTPTLYVSLSSYKDKWKLMNLFHKRDVKYKCLVTTSDSLLKPKAIEVIKLIK